MMLIFKRISNLLIGVKAVEVLIWEDVAVTMQQTLLFQRRLIISLPPECKVLPHIKSGMLEACRLHSSSHQEGPCG